MPVAEITAGITSIRAAHDLTKAYQSDLSSLRENPRSGVRRQVNGAFAETGIGEADLKTTIIDLINGGWCVPCAHERRGGTSSAAVAAMNSRRFIRSSSQLEETGADGAEPLVEAERHSAMGFCTPRRTCFIERLKGADCRQLERSCKIRRSCKVEEVEILAIAFWPF